MGLFEMGVALNLVFSAAVISGCSWLAQRRPDLAGFIVSLPLTTLLVLASTQLQGGDAGKTVMLARSILLALPLSLVFFVPFLMPDRFRPPFWIAYSSGILLLWLAYLAHQYLFTRVFGRPT